MATASKKKLIIRRLALFVVVAILAVVVAFFVAVKQQGLSQGDLESYSGAKIRLDNFGIPTIEGADWHAVLRAEGYVIASERLWQMDLIRRKAGGRLAAWFGPVALENDVAAQSEDRLALVAKSALALPPSERQSCEDFSSGVNRFIEERKNFWSIEYQLVGATPEPWTCADSLLVILEMADMLTASAPSDARNFAWRRHLTPAWQRFLFPDQHRWNVPLFGAADGKSEPLPPSSDWIAKRPLESTEEAASKTPRTGAVVFKDPPVIGSNNWAWSGASGTFLANDPHLGYGVPDIWYAIRLKVANDDWAVGATIPGVPGIVVGMNPHLAWAFTNSGEDVDDYLKETLRADGAEYLAAGDAASGEWRPVTKKTFEIAVKGEPAPRRIDALFTHRGPLAKRKYLGDDFYSRQWLALKDGVLRLPSRLMSARNLDEFDRAIDDMRIPSQNVVAADRVGNLSYRTSGTGVDRPLSGVIPQDAVKGEWRGLRDVATRRRLRIASNATGAPTFIATANQRIWRDDFGNSWSSDDRVDRIRTVLSAKADHSQADMEALQKDTTSRFRKLLLAWVGKNVGSASELSPEQKKILDSWQGFDGDSQTHERAFTHSEIVDEELSTVLLSRVRDAFLTGDDREIKYESWMRRAWLLVVLTADGDAGFQPFGLTAQEVARHLLAKVVAADPTLVLHSEANRWKGQHPFVGRVPVLGALFKIDEFPQFGAGDTPRAEHPNFGPSTRLVWNLKKPEESTWSFPVGQSGHAFTAHYRDFQALWREGRSVPVFPPEIAKEFSVAAPPP